MASALDVIAHEWGHGVSGMSANFISQCTQPQNDVQCQLNEGFADVIGHVVEKLRQPAGTGPEQDSDWTMHEDNAFSGYARGALDDGTAGHDWFGIRIVNGQRVFRTFNHFVHRDDQPAGQLQHERGNQLAMALRLLADGGSNPIVRATTLTLAYHLADAT